MLEMSYRVDLHLMYVLTQICRLDTCICQHGYETNSSVNDKICRVQCTQIHREAPSQKGSTYRTFCACTCTKTAITRKLIKDSIRVQIMNMPDHKKSTLRLIMINT
jgi:hypothetical protein